MPSHPESQWNFVAIQMEPGSVYFKYIDAKPTLDQIEYHVRQAVERWTRANPQFVIDRAQPVANNGALQGIHAWYHVNDHQLEATGLAPQQPPTSLNIDVHKQVLTQLPREHIEAVIDDAIRIWRSYPDRQETLVAINPRRIAVILDKRANRGAVVPFQFIEHLMDASMRKRLQAWLESRPTRFYVAYIPSNWLAAYEIESRASYLAEPREMRTNMTYDPGPRPKE
jgi:hypothetical protein